MTYEAVENSEYDAHAVELYFFDGTITDYALTSYAQDYTYNFTTYTSIPGLTRKSIKVTSEGGSSRGELEVSLPFDHPMVAEYAFTDTPPDLNLTLRRGHASDVDQAFVTKWTGPVTTFTVKNRIATLRVPSVFNRLLSGTIPRRRWQQPCNHFLYDEFCGVNPVLFQENTTITTIVGTSLTVGAVSWVASEGVGGEVINNTTGERRTIKSHSGLNIILKAPFTSAQAGHSVTLRPGCDLTIPTCRDRYNNLDARLGFNLVPGINPFSTGRLR